MFLHDYVNLYINARNKMMYKRRDQHAAVCILRIGCTVLDLPDVVISDRNASSGWARFYPSPDGLAHIDSDMVFAQYWTHEDAYETMEHGSIVCAEVLVPHVVEPGSIIGAYVSCKEGEQLLANLNTGIAVTLKPYLFFR